MLFLDTYRGWGQSYKDTVQHLTSIWNVPFIFTELKTCLGPPMLEPNYCGKMLLVLSNYAYIKNEGNLEKS